MATRDAYMLDLFRSEDTIYTIPLYQRRFSWEAKESKKLMKDLVTSFNLGLPNYFLGGVVCSEVQDKNDFGFKVLSIIDGQQRTATFYIMMIALRDLFLKKEEEGRTDLPIQSSIIESKILYGEDNKGRKHRKLILQSIDDVDLQKLLNGEKANSQIHKVYKSFYDYFKRNLKTIDEKFKMIERSSVVQWSLSDQKFNSQLVFSVINSSGEDLMPHQQIKNFLFMNLPIEEQKKNNEMYWIPMQINLGEKLLDRFLWNYTILKMKDRIHKKELYDTFRLLPYAINKTGAEILKELHENHLVYADLKNRMHSIPRVQELLTKIAIFDKQNLDPLLLKLMIDFEKSLISPKSLIEVLDFIYCYLARRFTIGSISQSMNYHFSKILKDFPESNCDYLKVIMGYLNKQSDGIVRFPTDTAIRSSIMRPVYNSNRVAELTQVLYEVEMLSGTADISKEKLSIEHIMPQTLNDTWKEELGSYVEELHSKYLHSLCNLTLTGYNSGLGHKSFKEKKEYLTGGYNNSVLNLSREISKFENWNEESMESYGLEVANRICEAFPNITEKSGGQQHANN